MFLAFNRANVLRKIIMFWKKVMASNDNMWKSWTGSPYAHIKNDILLKIIYIMRFMNVRLVIIIYSLGGCRWTCQWLDRYFMAKMLSVFIMRVINDWRKPFSPIHLTWTTCGSFGTYRHFALPYTIHSMYPLSTIYRHIQTFN